MAETTTIPQSQEGGGEGAGLLLGVVGVAAALLAVGVGIAMSSKDESTAIPLTNGSGYDYTPPSVGQVYETNEECYDVEIQTLSGTPGVVSVADGLGDIVVVNI